jgi:hypothetical protein
MKDLMGFRYRSFTVLAACHANLVLHAVCVACCNSCLVYYVLGHAFFLEWACDLDCQTVIYIQQKKHKAQGQIQHLNLTIAFWLKCTFVAVGDTLDLPKSLARDRA